MVVKVTANACRGTQKKILLPTLAYTLFVAIVFPLMLGEPVNYPQVAAEFAKTLFTWNPVIHNAQHLWYMYLYGLLVLAYPLLHWIKRNLLTTDARKLIFLMGIPAFLAANDFSGNRLLHAQMVPITVFIPGCLFVLAGSVLYEHRAKLQGKVIPAVLSLLVYAAAATVRSLYMQTALNTDIGATHLFGWYTGVGFVCSAALAVFILCMNPFESTAINALASNTLEVYILHVIVSEVITLWGWKSWVVTTFLDGSEGLFQYLKFATIYPLLVFVVCSIAAAGLKAAGKMLKRQGS